jgi:hypothetical protein
MHQKVEIRLGSNLRLEGDVYGAELPIIRFLNPKLAADIKSERLVVGVLGMDVLRKMALGFDVVDSTVTFWPGNVSENDARKWLTRPPSWPDSVTSGIRKIPLDVIGKDFVGLSARCNDHPLKLFFDTGSSFSTLTEGAIQTASAKVAYSEDMRFAYHVAKSVAAIAMNILLGSETTEWFFYRAVKAEDFPPSAESRDGFIGLNDLMSRRILVDLPGKAILVEDSGNDAQLSMFLSHLLSAPLRLSGKTLKFGPVYPQSKSAREGDPYLSSISRFDGAEVLSAGGFRPSDIVRALKTPDNNSLDLLVKLLKSTKDGYDIQVSSQNKVVKLRFFRPSTMSSQSSAREATGMNPTEPPPRQADNGYVWKWIPNEGWKMVRN